jgi:hypothetical protein
MARTRGDEARCCLLELENCRVGRGDCFRREDTLARRLPLDKLSDQTAPRRAKLQPGSNEYFSNRVVRQTYPENVLALEDLLERVLAVPVRIAVVEDGCPMKDLGIEIGPLPEFILSARLPSHHGIEVVTIELEEFGHEELATLGVHLAH